MKRITAKHVFRASATLPVLIGAVLPAFLVLVLFLPLAIADYLFSLSAGRSSPDTEQQEPERNDI